MESEKITLIVKTIKNTGFIAGGEHIDGTEELKFYTDEFDIYETSHSLNINFGFIADTDDNASAYSSVLLTKEGHEILSSKIEGKEFISSTQKSVTFSTPHSGEVDEWRLYVMCGKKG